jgi:hypothetical protein
VLQPSDPAHAALEICKITIPAENMVTTNGITFFAIEVEPRGGKPAWRILKRYSEILGLATSLHLCAKFPRKHLGKCDGDKLEKRRAKLELWLTMALEAQEVHPWMRPLLREFLQVREDVAEQTATPMSPSENSDSASAPPDMAEPKPISPEMLTLEIEIPAGVETSQCIQVNVPDGRHALVTVPEGYSSGMTLQFEFNVQDGTLSILS